MSVTEELVLKHKIIKALETIGLSLYVGLFLEGIEHMIREVKIQSSFHRQGFPITSIYIESTP